MLICFKVLLVWFLAWVLGDSQVIELPTVNIPIADSERNWGDGSCVHASLVSLMRWQGQYELATYWRSHYSGGETGSEICDKLTREKVLFAFTRERNVDFLEWACNTRRGCGITINNYAHMVTLVHLDERWACILDNNEPDKFIWMSRETLEEEWSGWAITPLFDPAPPLPIFLS